MNHSSRSRILSVIGVVAALVVVALVAYMLGYDNGQHSVGGSGPVFGRGFGMMAPFGYYGWAGWLGPLLFFGLLLGLLWLVFAPGPSRRDSGAVPPGYGQEPAGMQSGVDQLQRLADLHASGALSDEEFGAAKRRLLGL